MSVHFYAGGDGGATIEVVSTETLAAGNLARVENIGDANAAKLKFFIPQGIQGATGAKGATGATGLQGIPGTSLNTESIFSGEASSQGGSYSVARAINTYKALVIKANIIYGSSHIYGTYSFVPVAGIRYGTDSDLHIYLRTSVDDLKWANQIAFYFSNTNVFVIQEVVIGNASIRVGITGIWGVY